MCLTVGAEDSSPDTDIMCTPMAEPIPTTFGQGTDTMRPTRAATVAAAAVVAVPALVPAPAPVVAGLAAAKKIPPGYR